MSSLPILATVGHGIAWLAATLGQLAVWGIGIGLGYWLLGKFTNKMDVFLAQRKADIAAGRKTTFFSPRGQSTASSIIN